MPEGPCKVVHNSGSDCGMDLSVQGKSGPKTDAFGRKISDGRLKLRSWLNKQMRIEMSDGRILLGIFLCTDRDGNVILGSCTEYINPDAWGFSDEPRMLGLVMVPGKHIVRVKHDADTKSNTDSQRTTAPPSSDSKQAISGQATNTVSGTGKTNDLNKLNTGDPIEWSQNPLWDPNLSDSPDSEGPRSATTVGGPSGISENNQTTTIS